MKDYEAHQVHKGTAQGEREVTCVWTALNSDFVNKLCYSNIDRADTQGAQEHNLDSSCAPLDLTLRTAGSFETAMREELVHLEARVGHHPRAFEYIRTPDLLIWYANSMRVGSKGLK